MTARRLVALALAVLTVGAALLIPSVRCWAFGHLLPVRVPLGFRCPRCGEPALHMEELHDGDGHVDKREASDREERIRRIRRAGW